MKTIKFTSVAVCIWAINLPTVSFGFNDIIRQVARTQEAVAASNAFAAVLEPALYADCHHSHEAMRLMYMVSNFDGKYEPEGDVLNILFIWQLIKNGMDTYRNNFIRQALTSAPLDEVVRATGGDYKRFNSDAMSQRCTDLFVQSQPR